MAHRKSAGSTSLGRDSISKRLGTKVSAGQTVKAGFVLIRQRGTKFQPGQNVARSKDDTLLALKNGTVEFQKRKTRKFSGKLSKACFISVKPD